MEDEKYKIDDLIKKYIDNRVEHGTNSSNTRKSYERALNLFCEPFNNSLANINEKTLSIANANIHQNSNATFRLRLVIVKGFFAYLKHNNYIGDNPLEDRKIPKKSGKTPDTLSYEEVCLILDNYPKATPADIRDKAMLEVLYSTGCRLSEIVAMDLASLYRVDEILIKHAKGDKERAVFLNEKARLALDEYLKIRGNFIFDEFEKRRPLFITMRDTKEFTNTRISKSLVDKVIKARAKDVGITKTIYPHLFRHSLASHLLNNGMDILYIKQLLGHSSIKTTQVYTNVDMKTKRKVIDYL